MENFAARNAVTITPHATNAAQYIRATGTTATLMIGLND
jgi:hypothetical protein